MLFRQDGTGADYALDLPGRLAEVMALAGAEGGPRLLAQLCIDLDRIASGLKSALPDWNTDALRRHTHDLTALTGTIGALRLQDAAADLGQHVHAGDRTAVAGGVAQIARDIAALTRSLRGEGA